MYSYENRIRAVELYIKLGKHGADESRLSLERNFLRLTIDDKVCPWREN